MKDYRDSNNNSYENETTNYEPNFIMKDPDPETTTGSTAESSASGQETSAAGQHESAGTYQHGPHHTGSFRDPRENFRSRSTYGSADDTADASTTAADNTGGFSEEQLKTNEENAYKLGAVKYVTLDVTQEYYEKSLKYMVFGNVLRNGTYPISVSSERIFQALAIARYANEIGADAIAHGSTGAGNDQIRFDMTFLVLAPNVEIITLTRDMALSRQEEIDYLNKHGFSADFTKLKYSYNVGLWGTSICGGEILDSAQGLPETAYLKHVEKEGSEQLRLTFEKGELKAVNDETFDDPIQAIQKVEEIGAAYGIGRDMHVGDTIIGIKGRVGFEAAAPMLIIGAHRFLEKYTLSKWQQYWKDQVANWYGMFLHESQYLEPVMRDIEAMLQESQRNVNGTAILELRPLSFSTVGVESEDDLVKTKFGEYGEMQKGWTAEDAKGFIKVTSTPLRVYYNNHKDEEI